MNPKAAEEILDVIMLDDVMARRAALDVWARKWVATLQVHARSEGHPTPEIYRAMARELRNQILNGLFDRSMNALQWGTMTEDPHTLVCELHVVLQKPRDVDEGSDAAKRMMEMARGERS